MHACARVDHALFTSERLALRTQSHYLSCDRSALFPTSQLDYQHRVCSHSNGQRTGMILFDSGKNPAAMAVVDKDAPVQCTIYTLIPLIQYRIVRIIVYTDFTIFAGLNIMMLS